jgi:hypothetical protein
VFLQDALFPFLPSLMAWGYTDEQVQRFFSELVDRTQGFELMQFHLSADPVASLDRAAAREPPGWLGTMIVRAQGWAEGSNVDSPSALADYFLAADERARALLGAAPWAVTFVDAERPESVVQDDVLRVIDTSLPPS